MFGLFKKKDPMCGMKEEKDSGIRKYDQWFCSDTCLKGFEKQMETRDKRMQKRGCC